MDKGADPILVSLDGQRAADIGLVAVPCRNLLTDYVGRGTAGQGERGGEEVHRDGGCFARVGIEGVGTSFQRINGGIGGDLSDKGGKVGMVKRLLVGE